MDLNGGFQGFKKLHYFPNVALKVSKTDKMGFGELYEAPAGWHWGSRAEVAAIVGGGGRSGSRRETYCSNPGWG